MTETPNAADKLKPEAPSDRAGKVREIVEQRLSIQQEEGSDHFAIKYERADGHSCIRLPKNWPAEMALAQIRGMIVDCAESLLDAECKTAVAAALEQAHEVAAHQAHLHYASTNTQLGDVADSIANEIIMLSPDPNYIALREAEAEIAALDLAINCPELVRKQRNKMVEARDRIAKGAK